ncbi:hypothetical protein C7450_10832 [Chelatococcus asaccharovorans]|uniref:Uncharacterized protein n=1 Tax=Chelatococcus asaccharovorans TaxID=28210 RepID=A0A2V3U224_9HYPH|nr:hypothetical protein C7450_10832 [Chelatococcus asaccharovorans]
MFQVSCVENEALTKFLGNFHLQRFNPISQISPLKVWIKDQTRHNRDRLVS